MNILDIIKLIRILFKSNLLIFLFVIFPHFLTLDIQLMKNNQTFRVFVNNSLDNYFIYDKQQDICDCSPKKVYYENQERNHTIFSLYNIKQVTENPLQDYIIKNITLKSTNERIKTNLEVRQSNDSIVLEIEHYCVVEEKNNIKSTEKSNNLNNPKNFNYWGVIQLEFYIEEIKDKLKLEFLKFCKPPDLMGSIITAILLFSMSTIFVVISTYSEISLELTEIKQHGELKYWHAIIFIISGSAVLILIFYFIKYINIIFTLLISFQISLALFLTLKTLYEYIGLHKSNRFKVLNQHLKLLKNNFKIEIEIYSVILIVLTLIMVITYLIYKHWILNNIFGFALVFTILSLFHIRSFKICAVLLFSAFLYDVFWVYISPYLFTQNVMVVAATSLDMPIKLEMPIFFDSHPLKSCMFLGLGDLVLPGFVLKFCHRFDFIKKSSIYYKTSIFLYVLALTMSGVVIAIFNYPQPVLFYMCPIILGGIMITAYARNELDIWNAELLEENLQYGHAGEVNFSHGNNVIAQVNCINHPGILDTFSQNDKNEFDSYSYDDNHKM